ncbi:MAG: hypothetical protein H8E74_00415 [Gammaproteobacteria bacterium]|nr:hypothetical protein [Gammaproteobacteria bacterium]
MNYSEEKNTDYNYQPIDLTLIINKLLMSWKVILVITFIFSLGGVIVALISKPIYRADLIMMSAKDNPNSLSGGTIGALSGFLGSSVTGDKDTEKALAILTSRTFTEIYVTENNLQPILFPDAWDTEKKEWKDGQPNWEDTHKIVSKMSFINRDLGSGIISYGVEMGDPQDASIWVNSIIKKLNDYLRFQAIEEAENSIYFLREQLKQESISEAKKPLYKLIEEQTKNIMLANVNQEYAFKIIDQAYPPLNKIKPKRRDIAITGFVMGIFFSFLTILLKEFISLFSIGEKGIERRNTK